MLPSLANWSQAAAGLSSLEVHLLGVVEFLSLLAVQEVLVEELAARTDHRGILLVCEHTPTLTIGREGSRADLLAEPEEFAARQMPPQWLARGGGTLVHTVGQLAAYPLVPVGRLGWSPANYLSRLEHGLVTMSQNQGVVAHSPAICPGAAGRCGQFAWIGAALRDGISHHGVFVNVSPPIQTARLVRWPTEDGRVSSLAAHRQKPTHTSSVRESLVRNLAQSLGYENYILTTGHPLLRRTRKKVYVFPEHAGPSAGRWR